MEKLIEEVINGTKGAPTRFYRAYAPRLRRYLMTKLDEVEVEEILQDAFVSAFDSISLFRGDSSVITWLISIARHEVADFYRKKYVRKVVLQTSPLFENIASEIMSPEFVMKKHTIEKRFSQAFKSLSRQYQDVLSYRYELSMEVKDIAVRMDLSFKATESLLYRARTAFKLAYAERE